MVGREENSFDLDDDRGIFDNDGDGNDDIFDDHEDDGVLNYIS